MKIKGPALNERAQCEEVLRSLPMWFGIEDALVLYADDSVRLPTFAVVESKKIKGFISLRQHFPHAWELHCIAVQAEARNNGCGRALIAHAESWLCKQGAAWLQVKTVAATSPSAAYAQTREFYRRMGFMPLEVFPELWSKRNPCLQLVKFLPSG